MRKIGILADLVLGMVARARAGRVGATEADMIDPVDVEIGLQGQVADDPVRGGEEVAIAMSKRFI